MKKLLALVLALVMTLGLATVGANAAFDDKDAVEKSDYTEAITVLNGMGVFRGDKGSFYPERNITRAEVAAIIYRIYTADTADKQAGIYAGYGKFDDVNTSAWYAGYVGYCANAGFIKGHAGKFRPQDNVTGYEALAMILRAMGYDKNKEFTGSDWEFKVAETAQQIGILKNISTELLKATAKRELVAEILFQAVQQPCVTYTPAFGYSKWENPVLATRENPSLGLKNFGLTRYDGLDSDSWKRPSYGWGDSRTGSKKAYGEFIYPATKTYYTAVAECDVAEDVGFTSPKTFDAYVNAELVEYYSIRPLATNVKIGGQGRLTEVYYNYDGDGSNRIVMIDTYLAKVTKVTNATFDRNNHLQSPALMELEIYVTGMPGAAASTPTAVTYQVQNSPASANWTYAKGDYVLLNAQTNNTANVYVTPRTAGSVIANQAGSAADFAVTATPFGTKRPILDLAKVVGLAPQVVGAQTVIHYNDEKHTINGQNYSDALEFHLDEAKNAITNFTWFLDSYGNIIGSAAIATQYSYGVISRIWWVPDTTTGGGVAQAQVVYMDGTTATVTLSTIQPSGEAKALPLVRANTNTVFMNEMQSTSSGGVTVLPVSTYYLANQNADTSGIIGGHMFRFATGGSGAVIATEVDGVLVPNSGKDTTAITKNKAQNGNVLINNNTVFLIKGGTAANPTWSSVVGYANIGTYGAAEVDWVNVNEDRFAEYVYIIGPAATAAGANHRFVLANAAYTWETDSASAIINYKLTGYLDGTLTTITVPADLAAAGDNLGYTQVVAPIVNEGVGGGAFVLPMNAAATVVTGAPAVMERFAQAAETATPYVIGTDTEIISIKGAAGDTIVGDVYTDADTGVYYTGADTSVVKVGSWAADGDMSTKNVVLVYTVSTGKITEAYIYDQAVSYGPGVVVPSVGTINYTVNIMNPVTGAVASTTSYTVSKSAGTYNIGLIAAADLQLASGGAITQGTTAGTYTIVPITSSVTVPSGGSAAATVQVYPH